MRVTDLVDKIGDILGEDYTYAPIWTKSEIVKIVMSILGEFSQLTNIADFITIRYVDSSTGEADMPVEFNAAYYMTFSEAFLDVANWSDLDHGDDDWLGGSSTGTPRVATIIGSGDYASIRMVPTPSSVYTYTENTSSSIYIGSAGGSVFELAFGNGAAITTYSPTATSQEFRIPTSGTGSTVWEVACEEDGRLTTTASGSPVTDTIYFDDVISSTIWRAYATDEGALTTYPASYEYGLTSGAILDGTYQDFIQGTSTSSVHYGAVVDAYPTATATSPTASIWIDRPYGVVLYERTSTSAAMIWYKGSIYPVAGLDSELQISDAFVPILIHGILAEAFSHDGDGRDDTKAKLLRTVFEAECRTLKHLFQRWS